MGSISIKAHCQGQGTVTDEQHTAQKLRGQVALSGRLFRALEACNATREKTGKQVLLTLSLRYSHLEVTNIWHFCLLVLKNESPAVLQDECLAVLNFAKKAPP